MFMELCLLRFFSSFRGPAFTELCFLSLHDALPIYDVRGEPARVERRSARRLGGPGADHVPRRSEEHTSELQSRGHLVCRLLLEKKKNKTSTSNSTIARRKTDSMTQDDIHQRTEMPP